MSIKFNVLAGAAALLISTTCVAAAPMNYSEGMTENANAILVTEQQGVDGTGVVVDYVVGTDVFVGGSSFFGINNYAGSGSSLASGNYNSYLIHFDPIGSNGGTSTGSFSFANDIVALIVSNGSGSNGGVSPTAQLLNNSDSVFGLAGDTFETDLSRRSEGTVDRNGDEFWLTSANTLRFDFQTGSRFIDNVRVITAVPVPASLPLLLAGLGGFAFLKRRRRS